MRFALVCFLGLMASMGVRAADVDIVHVWPAWRAADYFERIGEYFGRGENKGREIVLRTQAADRGGYYFLVRIKNNAGLSAAKAELSVIRPDAPEPKVFTFPLTPSGKETVFQLGLTGTDWPAGKEANPVAWKIAVLAEDGRVLAEHKSFLWEKPAK